NVDWDIAVAFDDTTNGIGQPLRIDLPIPISVDAVRIANLFKQPLEAQLAPAALLPAGVDGITVHVIVVRDHFTLVVIQTDKIDDILFQQCLIARREMVAHNDDVDGYTINTSGQ